jgi:hypothetical protein
MSVTRQLATTHDPAAWFLKRSTPSDDDVETVIRKSIDDRTRRIRCPLCHWQPTRASRWCCEVGGTPEPYFEGCLTVWNTFDTRGRCPGCAHQWIWTTCHRCDAASLHEDWYAED